MTTNTHPYETNSYSVYHGQCHIDAEYNAKHFKGNKHRAGCVFYKGKCLFGNDDGVDKFENITTREAYSNRFLHSWCETKNGTIVDWVINDTLKIPSSEKVEWNVEELTELGFEYKPYINEKGILKKINASFGCSKKKGSEDFYKVQNLGYLTAGDYSCGCIWSQHYWIRHKL